MYIYFCFLCVELSVCFFIFLRVLIIALFSYKPQKISPKFQGTVRQLLHKKIRDAYIHPQFVSDVMKPMSMDS